jgi:enoyl-CoA hydratase/carnithine racemase
MAFFSFSVSKGIGTLTFDTEGSDKNVLSLAAVKELDTLYKKEINKAEGLKAIIVKSKKKEFCTEVDYKEYAEFKNSADAYHKSRIAQRILDYLQDAEYPTIAVIAGDCQGAGLDLALACQYRVAANNPEIKIGFPEVSQGLMPKFGGTQRLVRLIPLKKAQDMVLKSEMIGVEEAKKLMLVDELFESKSIDKDALALAEKLAADPKSFKPRRKSFVLKSFEVNPIFNTFRHIQAFQLAKSINKAQGNEAAYQAFRVLREGSMIEQYRGQVLEAKEFGRLLEDKTIQALFKKNTGVDISAVGTDSFARDAH